ncbi:hypothetical protein N8865_00300 [Francisellaceae bacterium]|nr:hypothetical protein [Francisellaceae bacterium]
MLKTFLTFVKKNSINFALLNGYKDIDFYHTYSSDIDIILKKTDFQKIEGILTKFCGSKSFRIVQIFHHEVWAKNIFLYNPIEQHFLNLDLYGELSRKNVLFFKEKDTFNSLSLYKDIPILSPEKEFIHYLVKKFDKNDFTQVNFDHLRELYFKSEKGCRNGLVKFFPSWYEIINKAFLNNDYDLLTQNHKKKFLTNFYRMSSVGLKQRGLNTLRIIKRIINPTGLTVSFLGPDGSGKSTIINMLLDDQLPFRRKDYFHLKPIQKKIGEVNEATVIDPHKYAAYSKLKSYIKLFYFLWQYNFGWLKNVIPLKIRSSLVVFDRYFDDLLVDHKRYRYGGNKTIVRLVRKFIPRPDLYFILVADAKVISKRKQEVPYKELERQVESYKLLVDGKRYFEIDVDRRPEEICREITEIMMRKMNERY